MNQRQNLSSKPAHPKKIHKIKLRKLRETSWTVQQQVAYIQFLKKHSSLMKSTFSRKINKVFKRISERVKTRTAVQVKSHHQKLQEKYETIKSIIYHVGLYIKHSLIEQEEMQNRKQDQFKNQSVQAEQTELPNQRPDSEIIHEEFRPNQFEPIQLYFFNDFSADYAPIEGGIFIEQDDLWI